MPFALKRRNGGRGHNRRQGRCLREGEFSSSPHVSTLPIQVGLVLIKKF